MKIEIRKTIALAGLSAGIAALLAGCAHESTNVYAVTGTVIGVQIHEKDTDKTPELKIGYVRSEFAYVPTDKSSDTNAPGGSATNSANVLMEINAGCNFGLGVAYGGSVYQRLAVGSVAVSQPGAAYMMARDDSGGLSSTNAEAIQKAISGYNNVIAKRHQTGNEQTDIARGRIDKVNTVDQFNMVLKAATTSGVLEETDAHKLADGLTDANLDAHKTDLKKYFHSSSDERNQAFEKFNEFLTVIVK